MKFIRISLVFLLISAFGTHIANAATYFSRQTGPWNSPSTWSTVGYGGAAAASIPTAADIVRIGNNNLVTVNAISTCLTLIIDDTGTLSLDGFALTVVGTTTVGNGVSGIVNTVNSGAGTKTFSGAVTLNANANWNLSSTNPATSFGAGIAVAAGATFNNGTGAAAFTANQSLTGAGNMTFGGTMTPSTGVTLTNSCTGTVTVLSTGSIVLTGNFTQGNNSNLSLQAAAPFSGTGTFNANTNANLVNYSGTAQTIKQVSYRGLTLSNSGVKTFAGSSAVGNDFIVTGSATTTTNIPTIGGNLTVSGTAAVTTGANLLVTNVMNIGATATLTMGSFSFGIASTSSVSGQLLTTSGNTGTRTFNGAVTINAGGVWDLSGQNPATSFAGDIIMNGATFNNGTGNAAFSASRALSGGQPMIFGGAVIPASGTTLTNNNSSTVTVNSITLTGNFTQGTNSTLILLGGTPFSGAGTFNANTNLNTVNYNGAAQTVKAVTYRNLLLSNSGAKTMTGVSTINGNFTLSGTVSATAAGNLDIGGNITLGSGTTFVAGAFTHSIAGNWVNNGGTFTNTNSLIYLDGATQSIGGTNSTTFNNLTIAGTGTTTLALATTVSNTIDIREGVLADLGGLTTHTANRLRLGGNGQLPGTWGGTGSGAANISSNYFTSSSGRITIAVTTTQALPFIEPFDGETDGITVNLVPSWNVTQSPSGGTFSKQTPVVLLGGEGFTISGTGATEGVWQTSDLDIGANVAEVGITLDISAFFTGAPNDYVDVYYVWDGGLSTAENLIASNSGNAAILLTVPATGHTKIRLVVRAKETSTFFGIPFEMAFDNVLIYPIRTLYSRSTAPWANSGTWSAIGINGVDCACTPSAAGYDKVFIGGGRTVTLGAAGAASNVIVYGTADAGGAGTLNLNTSTLTVDLGGDVTVNTGGVITGTATSGLTITDNQSHTITANGSVTIGALNFNNQSRYAAVTYAINGTGTFDVQGNFSETTFFAGGLTGQNNMPITLRGTTNLGTGLLTPLVFNNNATVNMTSTANNTLTGNGTWNQNANSTLNFSGGSININTLNASSAVNLVDYLRGGNQTIYSTGYWNLNLSTSGAKTLGGDVTVRGNWTRTGTATFAHANNRVSFNGTTSAQSIANAETFYDFTTQNGFGTAPQITLNGNVTVANVLDMNSGVINLNGFTMNLTSTASGALSHSGSSTLGWVYNGTFTRAYPQSAITIGNQDGLIPIGTATNFRPFYFGKNNNGGSQGTISMTHADAGTTNTVSIADTNPTATIITRRNTTWVSTLTGGGSSTFGIRYGGTGMGTVANTSHLRSMLLNSVIATNVAGSGSTTDFRVERSGLTPAQMSNTFYVGSSNAATTLPVTLVSFKGIAQSYGVDLVWETASEVNSDYFTVLRQTPEGEFKSIGKITGNGTTTEGHVYGLTDSKPVIGKNYYRLSQTDFDGRTTSYGTIMVEIFSLSDLHVSIYPNPVSPNRQINFEVKGLDPAGSIDYQIVDMRGLTVKRGTGIANESGFLKSSIDFTDGAPGIYILKVPGGQFKFVME